jgi:hypothetical protein
MATHVRATKFTTRATTPWTIACARRRDSASILPPRCSTFRGSGIARRWHSVIAPTVRVMVPSTALPAAPVVHSVIPLFRWSDTSEPEQPMSFRHVRRAGVRVYLERPWFSSGNGELLGVLLPPAAAINSEGRPRTSRGSRS